MFVFLNNLLMEQKEEILNYIKNDEGLIVEKILNEEMERSFVRLLEDVRNERPSTLILSITDPYKLKQIKFTDHEINIIKHLALENYIDRE